MRDAIHKEIEKLKTADVTDAELEMYKTRARADLLRGLDDNQGLADSLAEYQTRYGDWRELFLQLDQVDKVTKADIRRVANQVFIASNRTSAEIDTEPPASIQRSRMEARNESNFCPSRNYDTCGCPSLVLRSGKAQTFALRIVAFALSFAISGVALPRAAIQALGADSHSAAARLSIRSSPNASS